MQNLEHLGRAADTAAPNVAPTGKSVGTTYETYETSRIFRVVCPDCVQPIALLEGEAELPEHARITSQWNPFGLSVCEGSGRAVGEAAGPDDSLKAQEQDAMTLLTLPEGLDWRRQPFSHGIPGMRRHQ